MKSRSSIVKEMIEQYRRLLDAVTVGSIYAQRFAAEVEATYQQEIEAATAEYEVQIAHIDENFETQIAESKNSVNQAREALGLVALPWNSPYWAEALSSRTRARNANNTHKVPGGVRAGILRIPGVPIEDVPGLVPIVGKGHLFIVSRGATKSRELALLQSIVTRVAVTFPALTARFTFLDPLGLGSNFPFKRLPESIRGDTVFSEPDEIRAQLRELTEHLRRVQIKYLAREYENIERYNEDADEVVEPYRFLSIADFPAKFDSDAATRLLSIAEKGVRTGVYILMHVNTDSPMPRDFNLNALLQTGTVISNEGEALTLPLGKQRFTLVPDRVPPKDLFNDLMDMVAEDAKSGGFVGIPFSKVAPLRSEWWTADSRAMIHVPVGRTGARDPLHFWLGSKDGRNSSHALIGGRTGSGKSTLFHVLIASLTTAYSPEEVELYLVDFKEGVEFKPYADASLPHARVIAIESEREFGLSVLNELKAELERRGALFKEVNAQDLAAYRERTGETLPRLILIVDEFQVLMAEQDPITRRASAILEDLARRGRVFGIHLVLGSQSFRGVEIAPGALGQFTTRVLLQSPEAEVASLLGPDNVMEATLLERPGELIYNDDGGRRERNQPGQVALLREENLTDLLGQLNEFAQAHDFTRRRPQIVFRGNEATSLAENASLQHLYDLPTWPTAQEVKAAFGLREWIAAEQPALGWLGEAIEIGPHTAASFRRRGRSNLLLVGDAERMIFGMLSGVLLSLAGFYAPNDVQFRIIDLSLQDVEWSVASALFAQEFDFHNVDVQRRRGAVRMLEQVAQMVQQRQALYQAGQDELGPALYFLVAGAQRLPELRPMPGRFGRDETSEYGTKLIEIAQRGPEVGVHTILWYESVKSFDYGLGRTTLGYFDLRVALPMSAEDSQYLLRDTVAGRLPGHRAFLLDEDQSHPLEKFKPYALPATADEQTATFQDYADRLRRRLE